MTIATSAVSPVQLHATATLASGISRTALRSNVNVYQPSSSVVSGVGDAIRDTYVSSANAATNYGSDLAIEVGDAGGSRYGLLDFNLGGVPRGARIIEAKLTLNLESVGAAPGGALLSVHRMLEPWTEADATYKKADGSQNWGWPDNHDSTSVVLSIPFESPASMSPAYSSSGLPERHRITAWPWPAPTASTQHDLPAAMLRIRPGIHASK